MYGMFAAPVIAKLFLPQQEYFIALLYTYLTFTLGFFIRPLGALFFGYFSDKYGRKKYYSTRYYLWVYQLYLWLYFQPMPL